MQRWLKLPDGRHVDANHIVLIGKPETFTHFDEDGHHLGPRCMLHLGLDFNPDHRLTVVGSDEEVSALLQDLMASRAN